MKLLSFPNDKKILIICLIFFTAIVAVELIVILVLNSGLMVYTTDDAYIHLSLAENIFKGHYGVNLFERSSPSSSILWPVILAPFTALKLGTVAPLIINILSATGSIIIFFLIVRKILPGNSGNSLKNNKMAILFILTLIVVTNQIGMLFSGMEHSLQIFLSVFILWGLITYLDSKIISGWVLFAIVFAPLIRYENLALSFSSLIFLFINGERKKSVSDFIIIVVLAAAYSIFLLNLGLEPLPLSVLQKSAVVSSGSIYSVFENFIENILNPRGGIIFIGVLFLSHFTFFGKRRREEKYFTGFIALAVLLHLIVGKDGRYIVYIWSVLVLVLIFLYKEWIIRKISGSSFIKTVIFVLIPATILSYYYLLNIFTLPIASNNIYEQQYQMHRFAKEYYRKPVAVNDLGYVSYQNDQYVLDLVGLASQEALNYRQSRETTEWIDTLSRKHNVELAMIYDDWFDTIPGNWIKIAELYLGKIKIAASRNIVSFYLLNKRKEMELKGLINDFKNTLPNGVQFIMLK